VAFEKILSIERKNNNLDRPENIPIPLTLNNYWNLEKA
jgi:hypothetical protein